MPDGDPRDLTDQFNTPLPPQQEQAFQAWTQQQPQGHASSYDYDMRGWFAQNGPQDLSEAHLTDQFKKPNHPTFSDQSIYHGANGMQGGSWQQDGNAWQFRPGAQNFYSPDELKDYFQRVEPGNSLVLK
jgi:hypothetical protein